MAKLISDTEEAVMTEPRNTETARPLFEAWEETMILSCLQGVMGKVFVNDAEHPTSACAAVGCFSFLAGAPDEMLAKHKPEKFSILVPKDGRWNEVIERCHPNARRITRYAIKKDTLFDRGKLEGFCAILPDGYEMRPIDGELYYKCLNSTLASDFVSSFDSREHFLKLGIGYVILKDGMIVSGASSYTRYEEGIEIEIDTVESERRRHLATAAASRLILDCLDRGLYPSWDAHNMTSVALAKKLGYELSHPYVAYEVT